MKNFLDIVLLGHMTIVEDGASLLDRLAPKDAALLIYLLCQTQPQPREHLAELFWPERRQKLSLSNLRTALTRLRRHLAPYLAITRQTITVNHALCRLDVTELEAGLQTLKRQIQAEGGLSPATAARLAECLQLYNGDFLHGFSLRDSYGFEEWLLLRREQLRQQAIIGLHDLILFYLQMEQFTEAIPWINRLLRLNPLDEPGHRYLMQALARSGQRAAALEQYAACRRLLAGTLGVEPATETVALYKQIRSGEVGRKVEEQAEAQGGRGAGEEVSPLLPRASTPQIGSPTPALLLDWGEAPDTAHFYGREAEVAQLRQWLVTDRCRLAAILGIGGQGKTALAARVARSLVSPASVPLEEREFVAGSSLPSPPEGGMAVSPPSGGAGGLEGEFDAIIWRSVLNAPPLAEILESWLRLLSRHQLTTLPQSLDQQLNLLFEQARGQRCLLILDNAESLMQGGQRAGEYRPGYEPYGQLIRRFGESEHQSCLLLTSRERPREFTTLERKGALVRSLQLTGLDLAAGQAILQEKGLTGVVDTTATLINRYSGNPLALILVADTVQELFEGDISAFLNDEAAIFEDIQDVLNQQFGRLTPLEQAVMVWLAIEREPVSIQMLNDNLAPTPVQSQLVEAIRSLQRRSLIEKHGDGWTLQNVVIEYVTDRLVRRICREIEQENVDWFNRHALIKAQAREYVRHSQERLILKPVADWLAGQFGLAGVKAKLARLLEQVRSDVSLAPGYASGNILNLLIHLQIDGRGWDFSGLTVWQTYLRGKTLQEVNLAGADLHGSEFTDTFGKIYDIDCSPDGQLLAGATDNNQVRLWQVPSGQPAASLAGHLGFVTSVSFSPDGTLLASGSDDMTTCVWDVQTGQRLKTIREHTAYVSTVAFSPDGTLLASGSLGCLNLWNRQADEMLVLRFKPTDRIEAMAFSPDGKSLAVGFEETIQVWDVATTLTNRKAQVRYTLRGHTSLVRSLAFHPDGQVLASSSRDQTIRWWNLATGECLATLRGHTGSVRAVVFSPDGTLLASGGADQTIRLWNGQTGEPLPTLPGYSPMTLSLAFTPDSQTLFSSSESQTISMWDTRTGQRLRTIQGYNNPIHSVAVSPDGTYCASGSEDRGLRLWDIQRGQCSSTLWGHEALVRRVVFSPDGTQVASCGYDGTVRIWVAASGQALHTLTASPRRVTDLAYSPDGRFLAGGGDDGLLRIWYAHTGQVLHTLAHDKTISALAFHPNNETIASVSFDFDIRVWDIRTGQLIRRLTGHENEVWGLCFNPKSNILASSSDDETVRLWDVETGHCQHILHGQTGWMQGLAFSPDGHLLAGASRDGAVWLWAVSEAKALGTGQPLRKLTGHLDTVTSVAFNPATGHLVSGSLDETIRLWDVQTGACLDTWRPPGPYAGVNIAGARGLTPTQRLALKTLGAVED